MWCFTFVLLTTICSLTASHTNYSDILEFLMQQDSNNINSLIFPNRFGDDYDKKQNYEIIANAVVKILNTANVTNVKQSDEETSNVVLNANWIDQTEMPEEIFEVKSDDDGGDDLSNLPQSSNRADLPDKPENIAEDRQITADEVTSAWLQNLMKRVPLTNRET